ncbi:MAG: hypothetical protein AB7V18_09520 [Pyrinomonadaceae bacterium]
MKRLLFGFVLLLIAIATQTLYAQKQPDTVGSLNEDDQIRFVVLADLLRKESREKLTRCVAVDEKKYPSKGLLKKLKQLHPQVKSNARCYIDINDGDSVVDSVTGKDALLFAVSKLKRLDKDRVEVNASNYEANMASFGCKYLVIRENGTWKVESVSNCYIS